MSSEKKLTPFSEVQGLVGQLNRLAIQRNEIEGSRYFHLIDVDDPNYSVHSGETVLITVPAETLHAALFAIIDGQIKEVAEKLAAIGIGVE